MRDLGIGEIPVVVGDIIPPALTSAHPGLLQAPGGPLRRL